MRKILLVLTVLALTAPCWAAVSVSCSYVGEEVTVSYNCTGDGNDIRAFGIEVSVDNGGVISGIDVNDADYYIFPGSIDINSQGGVEGWGSAVAAGGNGTSAMTLEMGSLYDPCDDNHKTAPPKSGTLCTFTVATPLTGCTVSLARDTSRGGVVMEDGEDYATLTGCTMPYGGLYPAGMADWATWDAVGRPDCWSNPRQCHGDAANDKEGSDKLGWWYVGNTDLSIVSMGWKLEDTDPNFAEFICADFMHDKEGSDKLGWWRVGNNDLSEMGKYWKEPEVPLGTGVDPNCFD